MGISEVEVGKKYILRCGLKTNKIKLSKNGTNYKFEAPILNEKEEKTGYMFSWLEDGSFLNRKHKHRFDIVKMYN